MKEKEQTPKLLVYKASAGSGKTFTLAVQYITQLINDPFAYRKILAVTFTNKATAEMKKRILTQLYGIATSNKDSESYIREILKSTDKSVEDIKKTAGIALRNLIHDYSRFRIETIDSFFQSILRNLARELEIGASMNIEINHMEVLSKAVDSMIEKTNRQSPILGWLLEHIEERIADNKRWDVSKEIKDFGKNIFDESYIENGEKLRIKLKDPKFIPAFKKEIKEILDMVVEEMKGYNDKFLSILSDNGLTTTDLSRKDKGISSYFKKLGEGKLEDKNAGATVTNHINDVECWVAKTHHNRDFVLGIAENKLRPLLIEAESKRSKNNMIANSCNLTLKHLNSLRLLANIDNEVKEDNRMNNRFLLSDTNALLHSLIRKGDASFVYEKIGTTIDTVMIDEFQDTSRMQWDNFHLLLEESLSQKEGSLIVGDIKQSIYRWRNGDWKILANIDKDKYIPVDERTLDTNWRSESNIINFNNEIFTAATQILNGRFNEITGDDSYELKNAYKDVCQKTSKKTNKGYVRLSLLSPDKDTYKEATLEAMAKQVDTLISKGVRTDDIAILVRKNKNIPVIADYFDKNTPHRIVSDEAFRFDASLAICMIIDALRVLVYPEDRSAKARLAVAFQNEILDRNIELNTILLNDIDPYMPAEFTLSANELRFMPLYELMEKIIMIFDMKSIKEQDAYLFAFFDAVTDYMQNNSSELTAFISYWEETMCSKTIPSGEIKGIRILSIHKSKGLEYHTVLLPFFDWNMETETMNHMIWCNVAGTDSVADRPPFNELDIIPVDYSSKMNESIFCESYQDEMLQLWVDNLNLIYVAFTRACKNLLIWCKDGAKNTVSELLSQSAGHMPNIEMREVKAAYDEENENTDSTGENKVLEYGNLCASDEKSAKASTNRLDTVPGGKEISMESIDTDKIEFQQSNSSAEFIKGDDEESEKEQYIKQGQLLHKVFASIEHESDMDEAIVRLRFDGILESDKQEKRVRSLAQKALENPKAKSWFNDDWTLYNECSILYKDKENNMQIRRPDRVMMKDGKVIVVDFKFGKERKAYIEQVQEYMYLLENMGYKEIEGYLWYVYTNKIEQVEI